MFAAENHIILAKNYEQFPYRLFTENDLPLKLTVLHERFGETTNRPVTWFYGVNNLI